jgi:proline racemase
MAIKRTIMASRPITHPFEEDLSFLYGTIFIGPPLAEGAFIKTTTLSSYPAIIPEIEGTAHITDRHEFLIAPTDPLREGFVLR